MPDSVAEAYLLILRPTFVPVVGEAVPVPFNEQIEIDEWNWTLENEEYVARSAARDKAKQAVKDDKDAGPSDPKEVNASAAKKLAHRVSEVQLDKRLTPAQKEKKVRELMDGLTRQVEADDRLDAAKERTKKKAKGEDDDEDDKLTFTFKKNVDASTTQLLNSLKAGDNMPKAVLTLFHRSKNAPVTLVITFGNVRLKHYEISVDPTETMADLKESWTASYESVDYVYQNRPAASGPNGVTQGTARVFKKKSSSLF